MIVKSDIEVAREATMQPIAKIGKKLDIPADRQARARPPPQLVSAMASIVSARRRQSVFVNPRLARALA